MPSSTPTTIQSTTQQFLDIFDITNDLVIMKDGAASLIITVNAINFGLFAEEEQDAVIYAYAGLLNSLNYPIQIVIRSQTKDVTAYLQLLKEQEDQSPPEKKERIRRYRAFVSELIHEGNVLDKKFYVVIPATALEMGLLPPQTVIPGVKKIDISTVERSQILEKAKNILEPKRDHLISQFARIGLQARQLPTEEIIQLFYASYNPEAAEGQQLTDTRNYTTPIVSADIQTSIAPTAVAPNMPVAGLTPAPAAESAPQPGFPPAAPTEMLTEAAPPATDQGWASAETAVPGYPTTQPAPAEPDQAMSYTQEPVDQSAPVPSQV